MYGVDLTFVYDIDTIADSDGLQSVLDIVWCLYNGLSLNASNYNNVTFTRKENSIKFNYNLNNIILHSIDQIPLHGKQYPI